MDRKMVAKELLAVAKDLAKVAGIDELPYGERKMAEAMKKKGYNYVIQITTVDGDLGEPLYFKSSADVGPFLRRFPDYQNAKTKWVVKI